MHSLGILASQFTAHFLLDTFNFFLHAFYSQFWDKGPGSRKKTDVVSWLAEKGEGHVEELKLYIIHELLEF